MQITRFSDYALRVLIHLAFANGERRTAKDIAAAQGVSFNHLSKAAQWLASEGYVDAARGRTGGVVLALKPSEISLGALLRRSEGDTALVECFRADGGACPLTSSCGLSPLLAGAQEAFFAFLDDKTLEDVLLGDGALGALVKSLDDGAA